MRNILFSEGSRPISDAEVTLVEDKYGFRLPKEYREFLKETNGGQPADSNTYLSLNGVIPAEDTCINYFFNAVEADYEELSVSYNIRIFQRRIPSDMVPIANDSFGNLFLIGIYGERIGNILFWDHESELTTDGRRNVRNLYPIFPTFSALLESLAPEPDSD